MTLFGEYGARMKSFSPNARLFLMSNFFNAIYYTIFYLFFNLYMRSLGFEMAYVGLLNAVNAFSGGIVGVTFGIASDRVGRKRMLEVGTVLLFLSIFGIGFFRERGTLLALSIVLGASSAGIGVISSPFMIENSTEKERVHLFSSSSAIFMIVSTFGNVAAGFTFDWLRGFFSDVDTYRILFLFAGFFVFVSLLPLLSMKEKTTLHSEKIVITHGGLILRFTFLAGLVGLGAGFTIPYFNIFFKEVLGAGENYIGILFGIGSVFIAVSTLASPILSDRMGKVKTIFLGELSSIPFLFLIAFSNNLWIASAGYVIRGGLMNMANPILNAFTMEKLEKEERALASALTMVMWQVGWAVTSKLSGDIMNGGDYSTPYVGTIFFYLLSSASLYFFFLKKERR